MGPMIVSWALGMLKTAITRKMLDHLFIELAKHFAAQSDNKIDDKLVAQLEESLNNRPEEG